MDQEHVLRVVEMGVAVVALIVAGCVMAISSPVRYNDREYPHYILIIAMAVKTLVALALVVVAYRLAALNWSV